MPDTIDFARWLQSDDWIDIIKPWLELRAMGIRREFELVDPNDAAAVAHLQGRLYENQRTLTEAQSHFNQERDAVAEELDIEPPNTGRLMAFGARR